MLLVEHTLRGYEVLAKDLLHLNSVYIVRYEDFVQNPQSEMDKIYDWYSFNVIPELGELITDDRASYQYLVESIRQFPKQDDFAGMITDAGFSRVGYRNMSGGVVSLHSGWRL